MRGRTDRPRVPGRQPAPLRAALVAASAAAVALAVARLGRLPGGTTALLVALSFGLALAGAWALREHRRRRVLEAAYLELDGALFESERARDALVLDNEALARASVELRASQIAFGEVLNLADAWSGGRMRALIEETGAELAQILAEQIGSAQRVGD